MTAPLPFAPGSLDRGHLLNSRGRQLYRSLHRPAAAPRRVWVICPPLLEDATFGFRSMAELADAATSAGDAVLRFDYDGQGDSEGDAVSLGLAEWAADAADAVAFAREAVGPGVPLVLAGLGSGALVAARAASLVNAEQLLLIDPVTDGKAQLERYLHAHTTMQLSCYNVVREPAAELRERLLSGGRVSLAGHEVGEPFARSLVAARLDTLLAAYGRPTHVIAVAREKSPGVPRDVADLQLQPGVTVHTCEVKTFLETTLRYWELPPSLRDLCLRLAGAEVAR